MGTLAVVILAAGKGKRTGLPGAKVLLPLCGATLIECVLQTVAALRPERCVVVVHHGREQVFAALHGYPGLLFAQQGVPLGTGHAVLAARETLRGHQGAVLILYGDVPLVRAEDLRLLVEEVERGADMALLTSVPSDPAGLGRILRDEAGGFRGILEERDCGPAELALREVNPGFYCLRADRLWPALDLVGKDNAQGEYYLTDVAGILLRDGRRVVTVRAPHPDDLFGVNTLADLARVQRLMKDRILEDLRARGVIVEEPGSTTVEVGVEVGAGTRIRPGSVLSRGCTVGRGCDIGPLAWIPGGAALEDSTVVRGKAAWPREGDL